MSFDHEKLRVYQRAIEFVAWVEELIQALPRRSAVVDHLERSSDSVPLSIAEGNGKFTPADRCKFFDIARGSTLEAAASLDVLVARKRVSGEGVHPGKEMLVDVVSMLVGLIRSNNPDRLYEEHGDYEAGLSNAL